MRVVGVVVAVDEYSGRRVYTVDDSSGTCIECMITLTLPTKDGAKVGDPVKADAAAPPLPPTYEDIDVGSIVDVKGSLSTFRDEKQITIEKMVALRSTQQEVALWEKRAKFRNDVLERPWVLREKDIRRCRKEAERTEDEASRKKKRLKDLMGERYKKQAANGTKEPEHKDKSSSKSSRVPSKMSLRDVVQSGPKGRYDALGL